MNIEGDHLKPSIGFIGMGHMGSHMAQRLLDAGYRLTVYDRTEEKAQQMYNTAMAKGMDEDFSIMIKFMEELAGLSALPEESVPNPLPNR